MGLQPGDLFLVNRIQPDGSFKSYKLEYSELQDSIENDVSIFAGYVSTVGGVLNSSQFTSVDNANNPEPKYQDIVKFVFEQSVLTAKISQNEVFQIYNINQKNSATYKAVENGTTEDINGVTYAVIEVLFQEESETDASFAVNDEISLRSIGGGGGGEIIIDINPPADPEPGTLWYNPDTGITYIYYINDGDTEGQWVDVRPGAGGGSDVEIKLNAGISDVGQGLQIGDNWSAIPLLSSAP